MTVLQSSINKIIHGFLSADELLFFDAHWYADQIPSSHWLKKHPFLHYLKYRNTPNLEYSVNPLFDPKWYKKKHNLSEQHNAFQHYLQTGIKKDLSPHPLFDARWYKKHNSDVRQTDWTAFHHYHLCGMQEGRSPHPLFDARWYRQQQDKEGKEKTKNTLLQFLLSDNRLSPHVLFDNAFFIEEAADQNLTVNENPLLFYLANPAAWHIKPHPLFDPTYYQQQVNDHLSMPPLLHYVLEGHRQYNPHPLFNTALYLSQHPKLDNQPDIPPLTHFLLQDDQSDLTVHPLFDNKWYLDQHPSKEQKTIKNPLLHFLDKKTKGHLSPHPLFDPAYFAKQAKLSQTISSDELIIEHYIQQPNNWELATDPLFNPQWYKSQYQIGRINKPLLEHFLSTGQYIEASAHPLFDSQWYEERNSDVTEANLAKFSHYVQRGYREERTPHPLFDPGYYQQQIEENNVKGRTVNPLKHFLSCSENFLNPHPLFDINYFLKKSKEKGLVVNGNPLICYIADKQLWKIPTHPLFSPEYYQSQKKTSNLQAPLLDYIKYGSHLYDPHPLFNNQWYFTLYPKLKETQTTTPLSHYLRIGVRGSVSPHPLFNPLYYLKQLNEEEKKHGVKNPLAHFLTNKTFLNPHPLFDVKYFFDNLKKEGIDTNENPLCFFIENRSAWHIATHPLFSPSYYQKQVNSPISTPGVIHYLLVGHHKYNPHPLFDNFWYLKQFPLKLRKKIKDPLLHFIHTRNKRSLSSHPLFSPRYFARQAQLPEDLPGSVLLIEHYIQQPENWDVATDPLFYPQWYKKRQQISRSEEPLLMHFCVTKESHDVTPHPLFDTQWYEERNNDVTDTHSNSFDHYVYFGYKSKRSPHPLFDSLHYKRQLKKRGVNKVINPLKHFLSSTDDFLSPHPLFDVEYFLNCAATKGLTVTGNPLTCYITNKDLWEIPTHPLFDPEHYQVQQELSLLNAPLVDYIKYGSHLYDPHPLFDTNWYFQFYPRLEKSITTAPLSHYLRIGTRGGISPHPLFHPPFYLEQLNEKEKDAALENPLTHFLTNTKTLSPHPLFDMSYFLQQLYVKDMNDDTPRSGATVLLKEYLYNPNNWMTDPHILFDADYYQSQVEQPLTTAPLMHYIKYGSLKYNPHLLFHTEWYLGRNRQVADFKGAFGCPLFHFLQKSYSRGEMPHPYFHTRWYSDIYLNADRKEKNPLIHYLQEGAEKGFRPNPIFNIDWYVKKHNLPERTNALIHFLKQAPLKPLPRVRNRISDCFTTQMVGPVIQNPLAKRVRTLPLRSLIILFTPRSGSSWLTTLLMQTSRMGQPGEWFNPDLIHSGSFGLGDSFPGIREYSVAVQKAHQSLNGVFGAEVAYPHLEDMIELADVKTLFSKPHFIFHYRRNIVAQAVSLFMAVESGFFHSHQESNKKHLPDYNVVGIRKWVQEILDHEIGFAAFFRAQGLSPYISSYESLVESQERAVKEIAQDAKITLPDDFSIEESPMKKISSGKNQEYEMRFRQEEDSYMQYVQSARPMFESELFT